MNAVSTFFSGFLFSLCLFGCGTEEALIQQLENVQEHAVMITPNGQEFLLEIADSPEERAQGLMFREELENNEGMIFVFNDESPRSFWMKNTLIPLDVVYIDGNYQVVDIQTMQPCPQEEVRCPTYPSTEASRYAIELNAGRAASISLETGDVIDLRLP